VASSSVQAVILTGAIQAFLIMGLASVAVRLLKAPFPLSALLLPVSLLLSYWLVYAKIPTFPPVGAVNKVPYVIAASTCVGLLCDSMKGPRLAIALSVSVVVLSAVYIAWNRLPEALPEVALASIVGTVFVFGFRLRPEPAPAQYDVARAGAIGLAGLAAAPLAFLGASASTLQLNLTFAAATAAVLLPWLFGNRYRFTMPTLLGAAGGLFAVMCVVVLITQKSDPVAISMLSVIGAAPYVSHRICQALGRQGAMALHVFSVGAACLCALAAYGFAYLAR